MLFIIKKIRKCGTCFRYCEDWRDAKEKGLKPRYIGYGQYFYKPRPGIKAQCINVSCPSEVKENTPACKYHEYRFIENFKIWYTFYMKNRIEKWYRENIKVPIGNRRNPIPLEEQEPICPRCGEFIYNKKQCVFCGQRFIQDKKPY